MKKLFPILSALLVLFACGEKYEAPVVLPITTFEQTIEEVANTVSPELELVTEEPIEVQIDGLNIGTKVEKYNVKCLVYRPKVQNSTELFYLYFFSNNKFFMSMAIYNRTDAEFNNNMVKYLAQEHSIALGTDIRQIPSLLENYIQDLIGPVDELMAELPDGTSFGTFVDIKAAEALNHVNDIETYLNQLVLSFFISPLPAEQLNLDTVVTEDVSMHFCIPVKNIGTVLSVYDKLLEEAIPTIFSIALGIPEP